MKKRMNSKGIVVGIIILFFVAGITTNLSGKDVFATNEKELEEKNIQTVTSNLGTHTFYPTDDCMVYHVNPNTNYGDDINMNVRNEYGASSGWAYDSLVKFDISSISAGTTVLSASLYIYYFDYLSQNPVGRSLDLYRITSDWDEMVPTWNNQPSYASISTTYSNVPSSVGNWMEWDVTSDVEDFVSGAYNNYGWKITDETYYGSTGIPCCRFYTKDNSVLKPYLEIETYAAPTAYIDSINPNPAMEGESVTFIGHGTDPDGNIISYNWRSSIDGQLSTQASFTTSSLTQGTHTIYFKVRDDDYTWSNEDTETLIILENQPPTAYIDSITPNPAGSGEQVTFVGHGEDIEGSIIGYNWRSSIDGQLSTQASFTTTSLTTGTHTIYFKVKDDGDKWSNEVIETLVINENQPPSVPDIDGPTSGKAGVSHTYTASTTDPNGDQIWYWFDWGDDTNTGWVGPYTSGSPASESHIWNAQGDYHIKVKAKDSYGAESLWGTLDVTMPVNQQSYSFPLLQRLIERFPNMFPILRNLL